MLTPALSGVTVLALLGQSGREVIEQARVTIPVWKLHQEAPALRREGADDLKRMGPKGRAGGPILLRALCDKDGGVALAAAEALRAVDPDNREAVSRLIEALAGRDRVLAARVLAAHAPWKREAVRVLTAALRGDPMGRAAAAFRLGALGPAVRPGAPALVAALHDEDRHVRLAAAAALADVTPDSTVAVPVLIAALAEQDGLAYLQAVAPAGAAVFGPLVTGHVDPEAVGTLWACHNRLVDIHRFAAMRRLYAAEALGKLGRSARAGVPALRARLRDEFPFVREAAATALKKIEGEVPPSAR